MARGMSDLNLLVEDERTRFQYNGLIAFSQNPVSPNMNKLLLMSLVLAIGLCLAVPFLIEYLDHTVNMVDKAEHLLGLHGLGIVPLLSSTAHAQHHRRLLGAGHDGHSHRSRERSLLESFRVIRVNLQSNRDLPVARQVVMVTSSIPREGKSMVSSNLASSFARLGEKTLLIDADIRRGTLHRNFAVPRQPGLSAVLRRQAALDRCIVKTAHENLDMIPVGRNSSGVAESLACGVMLDVVTELRQRYQRIVIDTPPVLGISETCDILKCVDGVLLVIWSGYTPVNQIRTSLDLLVDNGAKMFGFILNRLDLSTATNYYYYFYYSDYYYKGYHHERLPPAARAPDMKNVTPAEDGSTADHTDERR
jgi:capsular exopolysaccharide synthesis family protein